MDSGEISASFDSLYVAAELDEAYGGVTRPEVQILAYLSCLLSVYEGNPRTIWGYRFTATGDVVPESETLTSSLMRLQSAGLLSMAASEKYRITSAGKEELEMWKRLRQFKKRIPYLRGATGTAVALPLPAVGDGVSQEPQLANSASLNSPRELLDEVGRSALYRQFRVLREALGDDVLDLMVPGVVWLTYLLEEESGEMADSHGGIK